MRSSGVIENDLTAAPDLSDSCQSVVCGDCSRQTTVAEVCVQSRGSICSDQHSVGDRVPYSCSIAKERPALGNAELLSRIDCGALLQIPQRRVAIGVVDQTDRRSFRSLWPRIGECVPIRAMDCRNAHVGGDDHSKLAENGSLGRLRIWLVGRP